MALSTNTARPDPALRLACAGVLAIWGSIACDNGSAAQLSPAQMEEMRTLIREEIRAVQQQPAPNQSAGTADDAPSPLTAEQKSAQASGVELVNKLLAAGKWTTKNRDTLRKQIRTLPPMVQIEVARPLIVALNGDKAKYEGDGPAF